MSTNVSRDPFARYSLKRRTYTSGRCAWCGACAPRDRKRLYTYQAAMDDSGTRRTAESDTFCNLECYRTYGG